MAGVDVSISGVCVVAAKLVLCANVPVPVRDVEAEKGEMGTGSAMVGRFSGVLLNGSCACCGSLGIDVVNVHKFSLVDGGNSLCY